MKKQLYLLVAALIIAPALSYGMAATDATPGQPATTTPTPATAAVVDPAAVNAAAPADATVANTTAPDPVPAPAPVVAQPAAPVAAQPAATTPTAATVANTVAAAADATAAAPVTAAADVTTAAGAVATAANTVAADATAAAPVTTRVAPAAIPMVDLPCWIAPAAPAPQEGVIAKLWNWLRQMAYPQVLFPTVDASAKVSQARLNYALTGMIRDTLKAEDIIADQTKSFHRRAALTALTSLAGISAMGAYVAKCGMPAFTYANGIRAAGTLLGGLVASTSITQLLIPSLNSRRNQRVVGSYIADIKTRGLIDQPRNAALKALIPANHVNTERITLMIDAMTAAAAPQANQQPEQLPATPLVVAH